MKKQSHTRDAEPSIPKEGQKAYQNTLTIGSQLGRTDVEMLQNPFYEGVQWKMKTIVKGEFKKTNHLRNGGCVKSQNIRGPYWDTRGRSITISKSSPIRRTNSTRSHVHSMPNDSFEVI